ncbi:anthranilate synthase component I family protein [Nesterenkonia sp. F]|uniref:anthranilate synthase component I family protein n=1 Tax=Nesterenkonia sp. F TaxID=795955 RepID=UPI0002E21518|nr:anthranilate synthase component I family protein [Nesterenkonia sp. F]
MRHRAGVTVEIADGGERRTEEGFFAWLRRRWPHAPAASEDAGDAGDSPDFALGWVGWLGHELWHELAPRPGHGPTPAVAADAASEGPAGREPGTDDARLFRATHAVVVDHASGTVERQSLGEDSAWAAAVDAAAAQAVAAARQADRRPGGAEEPDLPPTVAELAVRDSRTRHLAAIDEVLAEIREGTTYEACLTTAVTGRLVAGSAGSLDVLSLYRRLRAANRAPFTQLLRFPGAGRAADLLSTSPERFLSLSADGTARTEPIKGTRPRGADAAEDAALRDELASHPKDRAENVMITDLARNDLSIHAEPGTLRTERLCAVESYPTVHQLVSTVSARAAAGVAHADVVAAAFPPGSMTGAPKLSTLEILERLETGRRGPYAGVAGYFSTTGAADLSVLIRTLVLEHEDGAEGAEGAGDAEGAEDVSPARRATRGPAPGAAPGTARMHLGLGGAIVADSDPAAEWEEIVAKAAGVLGALGVDFPG